MFSKACADVLAIPEQQVREDDVIVTTYDVAVQALSDQFKTDPKLVYQVGLTPQKVSGWSLVTCDSVCVAIATRSSGKESHSCHRSSPLSH